MATGLANLSCPTYNKLLPWGLSMTIVGALGCWLFF